MPYLCDLFFIFDFIFIVINHMKTDVLVFCPCFTISLINRNVDEESKMVKVPTQDVA